MMVRDSLHRFTFEGTGVRGEIVCLDAAWKAVQATHEYPSSVAAPLGQSLAAVALLSATIKLEGSLILQIQGEGPLHTLVAQCTNDRMLRGMAHWRGRVPTGDLAATFGPGKLIMTAEAPRGERYQGIVALEGGSLIQAIETYFVRSEQLPTRLWLTANRERAVGFLLQRLPTAETELDWEHILTLAETLTDKELLELPAEDLLYRLFHEENVRLFDPEPVAFRCGCSRQRIEDALLALGMGEVQGIIAEQGQVQADCEFCNRRYRFDAVDVAALFSGAVTPSSSTAH